MGYRVRLTGFKGPLDLLLHVIRKNKMDIYTVQVATVANQYLEYIEMMQTLNVDGMTDFLLMASALAYHKSKMLLPIPFQEGDEDDEEDEFKSEEQIHAELIAKCEKKRYAEVARGIEEREWLNRDVFARQAEIVDGESEEGEAPIRASLFDLIDAFNGIIKDCSEEAVHEVTPEPIRLEDRIIEVLEILNEKRSIRLEDLVEDKASRPGVVITFLAILTLVESRLICAYQAVHFGSIQLRLSDHSSRGTNATNT